MASDPIQTTNDEEMDAPDHTKEEGQFKVNVSKLLNSPWPQRALTDPAIARSLSAQLRNWESWK